MLTTLVEIVQMPLVFIDSSYRILYLNEAAAVQVGRTRSELQGTLMSELDVHAWPELRKVFDLALAGKTLRNIDLDIRAIAVGDREWVGSFYPVRDGDEIIAVACTSMDVTELLEVKRELEIRNDNFAMLAQVNGAVSRSSSSEELFAEICEIAVNTGNLRYAWVGVPKDDEIVGVASAGDDVGYMRALTARGLTVTTDPADPRSQGPTGQAYLTGEMNWVNDYFESPKVELWREAAREVGFHGSAGLPILEGGRVVAILSLYAPRKDHFTDALVETLSEISPSLSFAMDRFELDRQRKASEAELILRDRALSAATQGVLITDARAGNHPITYVSPAFEKLTGYSNAELIGQSCDMLEGPKTDLAELGKLRDAIDAGRSHEAELLINRRNGEEYWNHVAISPIFDEDGTLTHHVGVHTDVTERLRLEEQVRQAQKMEAVGQLAGGVAHDFNNVLTAIRGSVDLAMTEVESASAREDLRQIEKAAEHAAHLTHQLLAFSRQQVLQPQSTDLNKVVHDTTALIDRVIGDDIQLVQKLGPDIESVLVDRGQLQQVIINLCINARDAMPDGGRITIATSSCDLDETYVSNNFVPASGRYVLLEIADSGFGMDLETQAHAFEPFFTTKSEGTGLGLATVYGIVSQMGGHVEVESEPSIGTSFNVYLPSTTREVAPARTSPAHSGESPNGSETILHVEDSEMLRPMVQRALGRHGYNVLSAVDAEEAIEIARERDGNVDLLLTDIVMPGLNGRELADLLHAQYPHLRVLFTSGYPADVAVRNGIAANEVNFIEKPFLASDLLPLIQSILHPPDS